MADNLNLLLCCLLAAICSSSAILCNPCNTEQCPEAVNCTAGIVLDSCQCCQVCAIPHGETCNTEDFGLCADGKYCLPDGGFFSGSLTGKCLDVTDCFSTGCEIIEDECECGYSNSCPTKNYTFDDIFACEESIAQPQENSTTVTPEIEGGECNAESPLSQCAQGQICLSEDIDFPHGTCQYISPCLNYGCEIVGEQCQCNWSNSCPLVEFPFLTMDECQNGLKASVCKDVECAPEPACIDGAYYEPGPEVPGECCPMEGVCLCDANLCPEEPDCPDDFEPIVVVSANDTDSQDVCCDVYQCKPDYNTTVQCEFENKTIENYGILKTDDCTTCTCVDGELVCARPSCYPPQCGELEEIVLVPGYCCPICRPVQIIDRPLVPSCEKEGEIVDPNNPCEVCFCYNGRTSCSEQLCSPVDCEDPIYIPGVCCPVCENDSTNSPSTTHEVTSESTTPTEISSPTTATTEQDKPTTGTTVTEDTTTESHTEQTTHVPGTGTSETVTEQEETSTTIATTRVSSDRPPITDDFPSTRCTRQDRYRHETNPCLTCVCVNGFERCSDQSSLCGEIVCENPIRIEGQCCLACDNAPPTTDSVVETEGTTTTTTSVKVITMVVDVTIEEFEEMGQLVVSQLEEEVRRQGYTLVEVKRVEFGKTQTELVLVIEGLGTNISVEELTVLLSGRISALVKETMNFMVSTQNVLPQRTRHELSLSEKFVIIISVLAVIVIVSLSGILALVVLIIRHNKKRRNIRKNSTVNV